MKTKKRGYILLQSILAMAAFTMMSYGLVLAFSSGFNMYGASKTALEAQQYAEITANNLKLKSYSDVPSSAHSKQNISYASGWQEEVKIGGESVIDASTNNKMRIATINVYKTGDTTPRYTLNVPLTSQGYYNMNDYYTKSQISQLLGNYYDKGSLYNKGEIDSLLAGLGGSGSGSSHAGETFSGNCGSSLTVPYNAVITFTNFTATHSWGRGSMGCTITASVNGNIVNSSSVMVLAGDIISYKITYNDAGNTGTDWAASTAPSLTYTGRGI